MEEVFHIESIPISSPDTRHDQFIAKLEAKFPGKFTLLGDYINAKCVIKVKCNDCGMICERQAVKLLYLGTCNGCRALSSRKTHEQFLKDVFEKHGDEYEILSRYVRDNDKVVVRHKNCNAEYSITASRLIQTAGCRFCQPIKMRQRFTKGTETFKSYLNSLVGDEYVMLEEYVNANTPVKFKHVACGREYSTRPQSFKNGYRCPKCAVDGKRSKNPLNRKISKNLRIRILRALDGTCKSKSTLELLGCSIEHFKSHLESQFSEGMDWDNYGRGGWHIDHIRPCASFDLTDPLEQQVCFHYSNHQPLWEIDNIRKHSWWEGVHYGW